MKRDEAHSIIKPFSGGRIYRIACKANNRKAKQPTHHLRHLRASPQSPSNIVYIVGIEANQANFVNLWVTKKHIQQTYHVCMKNDLFDDVRRAGDEKIDAMLEIIVEIYFE